MPTPALPITNESELNQALWALPPEGGVVEFSGTISITSTIVLGNGSDLQRSDYNGITLRGLGSGVAELDMGQGKSSAPSKLVWNGPPGGTMIQFAGPVSGIRLEDMLLDCNYSASTAIDSVRCFNNIVSNVIIEHWANGFAIVIRANTSFNGQGLGGGGAPHHGLWSMLYLANPGENASGIQIAPFKGNVNQVLFERCTVYYSPDPDSVGLDLGLTDHISFVSCFFAISAGVGGNSVQVSPPVERPDFNNWPQNITFYDTPITGGVKVNGPWEKRVNPALLFYPYYTADGQAIPPVSSEAEADPLPLGLVSGFTDQGQKLGLLSKGESRIIFSNNLTTASISNLIPGQHTYFDQAGEVYSNLLQLGTIIKLSARGRISKPTQSGQTLEILFYLGTPYISAAHVVITNTLDNYLWEAQGEAVVISKLTDPDRLVLRRLGGNLFVAFTPPANAWSSGTPMASVVNKLQARVSAKWHSALPVGCSVVMDSFVCEIVQG